eukprot:CAMPEP_0197881432 /NCGR_PEP_ID=MMETSP1439-20131203/8920_1 /TAXON_ID=66791 /ORGANISM="Gonyaulax spinifera, Strain CCMP409" /LENGTH=108 /DNA_ID=CAMNT_0043501041 /DNA_START=145 /DNA_END=471 /DNA_ORIENTATION=-
MVLERCNIVTSAPCSHRSWQMSCADVLEPITIHFWPLCLAPPWYLEEWNCTPLKMSAPLNLGTLGYPDMPVAKTSCSGSRTIFSPARSTSTFQLLPTCSTFVARVLDQ